MQTYVLIIFDIRREKSGISEREERSEEKRREL